MIEEARKVMVTEANAIVECAKRLNTETFQAVVGRLVQAPFIHVSGVGKSGDISQKFAGMLCSYGVPAAYLDPCRAMHGDLGRVRPVDTVVLVSRSGACEETVQLAKRFTADRGPEHVIGLTTPGSQLAHECDLVVDCAVKEEADPWNLAPTASTAATLAVMDALATCVARARGFSPEDFQVTHPGGPARQPVA